MRPSTLPLSRSLSLVPARARAARLLIASLVVMLALLIGPTLAHAGPPSSSRSGSASTSKPNSSSSSKKKTGFQLPDFVYGGNAVSLLAPVQVGLTRSGWVPRGRIGLQYDRQLHRPHWVHVGVAAVFDRGGYKDFRIPCGLDTLVGTCDAGSVAGMDVWLGYTYKLYIEKTPWLVPIFRAGLAGGFWKYPRIGASREQARDLSWTLGLQAGAGLRIFLLRELALGLDIEFRPSLAIHREQPAGQPRDTDPGFVLPLQILPLIVEWRF